MALEPRCTYPVARSFVLKLHRDAQATPAGLAGRIESLTTGVMHEFRNGEELLALLAAELARPQEQGKAAWPPCSSNTPSSQTDRG
jgi:hypothetical protein